jgi:hypothetical protein
MVTQHAEGFTGASLAADGGEADEPGRARPTSEPTRRARSAAARTIPGHLAQTLE